MVAGPQRVMSYFPYEAKPAIFSSAVLLHEVAGLSATLQTIKNEDWRRKQLWHNVQYLRRGLARLGYSVGQSDSQIVALHSGSEAQTRALRDALEERGVFGAVFAAPATPKNHSIIRLSVNARLSEADLDRVIAACADIARNKLVNPWPRELLMPERSGVQAHAADAAAWRGFDDPIPAAGS
jgi:CAI-1 autoinducer synthase